MERRTSTLVKSQVFGERQKLLGINEDSVCVCSLRIPEYPISGFERTTRRDGQVSRDNTSELRTQDEREFGLALMFPLSLQNLGNQTSSIETKRQGAQVLAS